MQSHFKVLLTLPSDILPCHNTFTALILITFCNFIVEYLQTSFKLNVLTTLNKSYYIVLTNRICVIS